MLTVIAAAALYARVTVISPREGMSTEFESGYRRHLDWHRGQNDPWSWLGWTVISGERLGWFVDGTFERTLEELDKPVAPAADAADNQKNVAPHGRFHSHSFYRHRPDLANAGEQKMTAPLLSATWIQIRPGKQKEFEAELRRREITGWCLELISGGATGSYLLLRPAARTSALVAEEPLHHETIERAYTEALRFRPDLTYQP